MPGIRPANRRPYIWKKLVTRLTLVGAIYIAVICLLPEVLFSQLSLASIFGGTSILIMVVVALDFMEQIQHYMLTQQYGSLLKNSPAGGIPSPAKKRR